MVKYFLIWEQIYRIESEVNLILECLLYSDQRIKKEWDLN